MAGVSTNKMILGISGELVKGATTTTSYIRRDANNLAKDSEKNNEISQDEMKRLEAEVQRVTDTFIESIENELKKKEADLSEI